MSYCCTEKCENQQQQPHNTAVGVNRGRVAEVLRSEDSSSSSPFCCAVKIANTHHQLTDETHSSCCLLLLLRAAAVWMYRPRMYDMCLHVLFSYEVLVMLLLLYHSYVHMRHRFHFIRYTECVYTDAAAAAASLID